ncbi:MAG TPA: hypothetical protein DD706_24095 [Nitrospiraceae bacterium]|nr:hypothetical protein [Nitrospiraceae bacterium]
MRDGLYINPGQHLGQIWTMTMEDKMSTRILVVDDETDCARFVAEAIGGWGFEVVATLNGREGLDVFHAMPFDGILLDLEMPAMNGWTMLDEPCWMNRDGWVARSRSLLCRTRRIM